LRQIKHRLCKLFLKENKTVIQYNNNICIVPYSPQIHLCSSGPIFIILLLAISVLHSICRCTNHKYFHISINALLHYPVKFECSKLPSNFRAAEVSLRSLHHRQSGYTLLLLLAIASSIECSLLILCQYFLQCLLSWSFIFQLIQPNWQEIFQLCVTTMRDQATLVDSN